MMLAMKSAGIAYNVTQENLFGMEVLFYIQNHFIKVDDFTALLGSSLSSNARGRGWQTYCY